MLTKLLDILTDRILVMDGAMGTMIQQYNLSEEDYRGERFSDSSHQLKGNNDILSLTQPQIIRDIHRAYLVAGADILETNTFNSTNISQGDYGTESIAFELNKQAAVLAKSVVEEFSAENPDKPRFVAGAIGPTNKTTSLSPDVSDPGFRAITFDELVCAYSEQIMGLIEGGVDILIVETVFDTLNCKAAIFAIDEISRKNGIQYPVMISGTITDSSGRTLSGQTTEAFWIAVSHTANLLSVGLNCALGAEQMRPFIEELSRVAPVNICAYPNAGLPNEFGEYVETPQMLASHMNDFARSGFLNIAGGCCGTTPAHIRAIVDAVSKHKPRRIAKVRAALRLSGLEAVVVTPESNFINIGERTNVAGSKRFAKLIISEDYESALNIARRQVDAGAIVIDVNFDEGLLASEEVMTKFINLMASEPEISRVPFMIDSSKWSVIESGLKCMQGKGIVNSISLKEGEKRFKELARKIQQYGAAVVVMAFDESGQADSYERKCEICKRAYDILVSEVGFTENDIIFDPNVLTVATGIEEHNGYGVAFIEATRWIKENLPGARVSAGVSNVSFSFRGNDTVREAMHSAFLYHAIRAGLDMGIVNAAQLTIYENIPGDLLELVEDVLLNRREDATERLVSFAENVKGGGKSEHKQTDEAWRSLVVEEKIKHALVKGIVQYIESDVTDAKKKYGSALDVVEGPLMDGMNVVGELFGSGKMFLPQVVKSARVMKKAVARLIPDMEKEKQGVNSTTRNTKMLIATVKGDVHDIGKNIVSVVLGCNNYEMIDLGVMVSCDKIVDAAISEEVDIIGLSGLITPSLDEMVHVAREMERRGLKLPLVIGGATTSKKHTAVKIVPTYSGPVVHVLDASKSVAVVGSLVNEELREGFLESTRKQYDKLRDEHLNRNSERQCLSIARARENKLATDWSSASITVPKKLGVSFLDNFPLDRLVQYIDWMPFFNAWEMKGKFPGILSSPHVGQQARELFDDANKMLARIIQDKSLRAQAIFGLFPANTVDNEDIEVYADDERRTVIAVFHTLRQQGMKRQGVHNLALSDYIAPEESGVNDYIGAFAVTAGIGIEKLVEKYEKDLDDYSSIMVKALADRLAEALAECLHLDVRRHYWAYAPMENLEGVGLIREQYRGIRPAPGYPACPDHSEKRTLFSLLRVEQQSEVSLTETFAMYPAASVCGLYFDHSKAKYFGLGKISKDQIEDYAERKGMSTEEVEQWLSSNLNYR